MVISLFSVYFLAVLTGFAASKSLHLPGVSPTSYNSNDPVKVYRLLTYSSLTYLLTHSLIKLFVTKLTSIKTQIPYDYYALPYCKPSRQGLQSENIGEVLSGDRIGNHSFTNYFICLLIHSLVENSVYQLKAKEQKTCQVACAVKLKKEGKDQFVRAIDDEYHVHWIVDNLPVGMSSTNEKDEPGTHY